MNRYINKSSSYVRGSVEIFVLKHPERMIELIKDTERRKTRLQKNKQRSLKKIKARYLSHR